MKSDLLIEEFDRQLNHLLHKGYPDAADKTQKEFLTFVEPLKEKLEEIQLPDEAPEGAYLPFVIVVKRDLVSTADAMKLVDRNGKNGVIAMHPRNPDEFIPLESVKIPTSRVYLLVNIDRGTETLNVAPKEAFKTIIKEGRSPLTIDEGLAIITHYPDFLQKNNCFSLLASRMDDKRVPAIWISEGRPKLGWCWEGNPHTWLGSASCLLRIG